MVVSCYLETVCGKNRQQIPQIGFPRAKAGAFPVEGIGLGADENLRDERANCLSIC